ncbi:XerC/D-like integrase [Natrialba hulunbeirensis JCM 10989]|uniref:XerC/D-like integrase n=1 Tax=Natrialba hulunbeirensis JCM 10989 TaxID=1227493 RepID=M0A9C1_9EURY|nr:site-specific integrase [Natrialba hulunbeirensis]ELY95119.1 XerC/D-like integrase [Natrialba hulunbeirensis JCM 10989]
MDEIVSELTREVIGPRKLIILREDLKRFETFMIQGGKAPNQSGLADSTVNNYLSRIDQIYRAGWAVIGKKQVPLTPDIADQVEASLAEDQFKKSNGESYSPSSKRKFQNTLKKYFEYRAENGGRKWEPEYDFEETASRTRDYFKRDERSELRDASISHDQLPHYSSVSPEERARTKRYLAQKTGVPKKDITREIWNEHRESLKIPSLVFTSLDAALRPIEVNQSTEDWLRLDTQELHIPKENSSKGRENWHVSLSSKTAQINREWMQQRDCKPKYDGRDEIWLNRQGNPYCSKTLCDLLNTLLEQTDIDTSNRDLSWYSIRHSTGTYMTEVGDMAQASEQLRHDSFQTTKRYYHSSVEERSNTLEEI